MRKIQPVAANVPYMVCAGNHEFLLNFTHYTSRFSMLGDRHSPKHDAPLLSRINNHFHTLTIGPATIITINTEFYYFMMFGIGQIWAQYDYLEQMLIRANQNRHQRPWIIVMGHRPMYSTNPLLNPSAALSERPKLRLGLRQRSVDVNERSIRFLYGLEKLFYKYGVDLQFYGHDHLYSRLYPIFDFQVRNGTDNPLNPYDNAMAPIHIVTGSAVSVPLILLCIG